MAINTYSGRARQVFAGLLPALCIGLASCASSQTALASDTDRRATVEVEPTQAAKPDFTGDWSVQWCDKTDPAAECGGFDVTLAQAGDKISGESFGARVRLAQTDEGGIIHGIAVGNTAVLTVESLRSGGIYLIQATVDGRCMRWKIRETVHQVEQDIDIIAMDDVLTKKQSSGKVAGKKEVDCRGIPTRARD
ncbi:hypothetical protein [Lysobacter fragariae]